MAQQAPTKGRERVFVEAIESLKEFVGHAREDLEFVLDPTVQMLGTRVEEGRAKYGTYLETFNGRDALKDAWEEAADLMFYTEQAMMESDPFACADLFVIADLAREALLLLTERRIAREAGLRGC